ncbi:2828_t:CDS:2 [Entrophospora sp. SA101]|nr:2828_t:CDS:2 [Entrophospora sp. SA101]
MWHLGSDDDVSDVNSYLSVFNTISKKETEWKLKNGKLVTEILAEGTMKTMEASKTNTKRPKAFYNNVIRLGLSYIVDLTSEFEIGMHTFFGEEWDDLKTKVYGQLNLTPLHFEGIILETIKAIEEARELILDKMKNQSASVNLDMFLQNPYVFICEDGQKRKLTEMEYVLKVVAPILDVVFSNVSSMINLRTKCRKIDLRIECRVQGMEVVELSHSSAAPSAMPAKTVRDRNEGANDSIIFGFQFSGPSFCFPSQLLQLKSLQHALEDNIMHKVELLSIEEHHPYKKIFGNKKKSKPTHKKLAFIRSTHFTPKNRKNQHL